ncbi:uroporphyrinogen-III synthase [Neocloeon triangulifer]|uniref:uroporphyrinogen-III synthase n=1 Tax=Neocloeon triangulifer TaxID=2078957 RepID=UPI00286F7C49|nr:uroporphyrinogen-III synthase [Neocloeon triangulifer]
MEHYQGARVAIFKAETDKFPDPYVEELEKVGFLPKLVPVITFDFFNLDLLKEKLSNHDKFSGLILSSERCALAVHKSIEGSESILLPWKSKIVVCAGEATAEKTKNLTGLSPIFGEKQRAEGIIDLLESTNPTPRLMLNPCGELAASRDSLATGLSLKGINCECLAVYKTIPNPCLKSELENIFVKEETEWPKLLIFFSPSGLKAVMENLVNCEIINFCKLVSIGPSTSTAIRENGFTVWAEAENPNPKSLREAIEKSAYHCT